jgi:hypothetical protein
VRCIESKFDGLGERREEESEEEDEGKHFCKVFLVQVFHPFVTRWLYHVNSDEMN